MNPSYFTQSGAQGKVGKKVMALIEFANVPAGSTGRVVSCYKHSYGRDVWGVMIAWDDQKPLQDGFSKDEYEDFLEEQS